MKEWHKSRSFPEAYGNAMEGIKYLVTEEANIRLQLIAGIAALLFALLLSISVAHLAVLVLTITLVIALEMINTVLELLQDIVHPEYHQSIKQAKDVSAAAVLTASFGSVVIGLLIFIPPIVSLFGGGA